MEYSIDVLVWYISLTFFHVIFSIPSIYFSTKWICKEKIKEDNKLIFKKSIIIGVIYGVTSLFIPITSFFGILGTIIIGALSMFAYFLNIKLTEGIAIGVVTNYTTIILVVLTFAFFGFTPPEEVGYSNEYVSQNYWKNTNIGIMSIYCNCTGEEIIEIKNNLLRKIQLLEFTFKVEDFEYKSIKLNVSLNPDESYKIKEVIIYKPSLGNRITHSISDISFKYQFINEEKINEFRDKTPLKFSCYSHVPIKMEFKGKEEIVYAQSYC